MVALVRLGASVAIALGLVAWSPSAGAAETETVVVSVQDQFGQPLGDPRIGVLVTVCQVGPGCPGARQFGVNSSGQATIPVDPALDYGMGVTAYSGFYTETGLPLSDTPVVMNGVGQPRDLTATITVNGVAAPSGSSGIALCPVTLTCSPPNAPVPGTQAFQLAFAGPGGIATAVVNSSASYRATAFTFSGGPRQDSATYNLAAGTTPATLALDIPSAGTTYTGHLSRTGFDVFAPQTAGVGACPVGTTYPGDCVPVVAYAAPDGAYSLRLAPGSWTVAGFLFIDNVPVKGAPQVLAVVDGPPQVLDVSADVNVAGGATLAVPVQGTGDTVTVATDGAALTNVVAVPAPTSPPPPSFVLATGVVSFTAGPVALGSTVVVDLTFDQVLSVGAAWYKIRGGVWTPYPDALRIDDHTMRVTLVDGGTGDDDGIVNGYLTDPGAVLVPPTVLEVGGFLAPLDGDEVHAVNAGRTIPVKWRALEGGVPVSDPAHFVGLHLEAAAGSDCDDDESPVTVVAAGGSGLQYLGDGYWQFNWKTSPSQLGCRTLVLETDGADPVTTTLRFR
jgi:hypothetical protein